ncbi:MAG TPA: hypothetical protein VET24_05275 [Actinomycetota bacterium]|nr:hypothetical protein [Actinomycetota bacterium]
MGEGGGRGVGGGGTAVPDDHGVLVIRAWVEAHPEHPLRAVITQWSAHGVTSTTAAASVEEVASEVEAWLRRILAGTAPATEPG